MHALIAFALVAGALPGTTLAFLALRHADCQARSALTAAEAVRAESARALQLEREHARAELAETLLRAQHERSELITRCMDPSLVAALVPSPIDGDGQPAKLHISEDDEIRREAVEAIEAELAAREGALA